MRDDKIVTVDNYTVKFLNVMHFKSKAVQFVSSDIPRFDAKIINMQEDDYVGPSFEKWRVSTKCATHKCV